MKVYLYSAYRLDHIAVVLAELKRFDNLFHVLIPEFDRTPVLAPIFRSIQIRYL